MRDDRSTVIINVKNVKNVTRLEPADTLFPGDDEYHDDVAAKDPNFALGATGVDKDVAVLSDVDIEGKDQDYLTKLIFSDASQELSRLGHGQKSAFSNFKSKNCISRPSNSF